MMQLPGLEIVLDKVKENIEFWAFRLGTPYYVVSLVFNISGAALILGFLLVTVMFLVWLERKISAHLQARLGPMRTGGWHGWSQTIADAIKLLLKEDIIPASSDKWVHRIAALLMFIPAFVSFAIIPFDRNVQAVDLNVCILFIFAFSSITVIAIVMAGWGSNNKYSLFGALRSAAQMISYEVPLVLSVVGVIMITGSLKMSDIVNAQSKVWFIFVQPVGFILYIIAGLAEINRVPFDIPEAESELVSGYHTEYSGMKFAFFFLAEYANMFLVASIATTLFLGGWNGPFLPPFLWFLIKTYSIVFIYIWARWTLPRLRVDRLMDFGWKVLMPLAFLNIIITAIVLII